jgi:hypothetical protein
MSAKDDVQKGKQVMRCWKGKSNYLSGMQSNYLRELEDRRKL